MHKRVIAFLLALTVLCPIFSRALAQEESVQVVLGTKPSEYQVISADGLDIDNLTLNGIPYQPDLSRKGDILLRPSDLQCADEAQQMVGQGDLSLPDFTIASGMLHFPLGNGITMNQINQLIDLLEKYFFANMGSNLGDALESMLWRFYTAQVHQGSQEEQNAMYIRALKNVLANYKDIFSHETDRRWADLSDETLNNAQLDKLIALCRERIDCGIAQNERYTPSPAAATQLQGNRYVLASGGELQITLEVKKILQPHTDRGSNTGEHPAPAP